MNILTHELRADSKNGNTEVLTDRLYEFFKQSRFQDLITQIGVALFVYALGWKFVDHTLLTIYLAVTLLMVLVTGISYYSPWTNRRYTAEGLPRYVIEISAVRLTVFGSLCWFDIAAAQNMTFVLAILVTYSASAMGSMVTMGPFKRLTMLSLTALFLPSALACLYVGFVELGIAVLFFIYVIAYRGVKQIVNAMTEVMKLQSESVLANQMLVENLDQLRIANHNLEIEMSRRETIDAERQRLQEELVDISIDACKAEVATGVLHNVGNVMNSVNVTAGMMRQKLKDQIHSQLSKAVTMLSEYEDDLGRFFTSDARRKHFMPFLRQLNDRSGDLLVEVQSLIENVDHVNSVVTAQRAHATTSAQESLCEPEEIIQSAIQITTESFRESRIKLNQSFDKINPVVLDKEKLLQVLVNLLSNARNAIDEAKSNQREVSINLRAEGCHEFKITIMDTGIGIAAADIEGIFSQGFLTRNTHRRYGSGLHHNAQVIQEMGGTLTATSGGKNQGACFQISLPIQQNSSYGSSAISDRPEYQSTTRLKGSV